VLAYWAVGLPMEAMKRGEGVGGGIEVRGRGIDDGEGKIVVEFENRSRASGWDESVGFVGLRALAVLRASFSFCFRSFFAWFFEIDGGS